MNPHRSLSHLSWSRVFCAISALKCRCVAGFFPHWLLISCTLSVRYKTLQHSNSRGPAGSFMAGFPVCQLEKVHNSILNNTPKYMFDQQTGAALDSPTSLSSQFVWELVNDWGPSLADTCTLCTGKTTELSNSKIIYFSLIKPRSNPVISNLIVPVDYKKIG